MKNKLVLAILVVMAAETITLPLQNIQNGPKYPGEKCLQCRRLISSRYRRIAEIKREAKKDLFVSRGWGAGGMPFSVLYMNPHASKMPHLAENSPKAMTLSSPREHPRSQLQVRTSMTKNKYRSVIPQLFVSYGWGPLGK